MNEDIRKHLNEAFKACEGDLDRLQDVLGKAMMKKENAQAEEISRMMFACIAGAVLSVVARSEERKAMFDNLNEILC